MMLKFIACNNGLFVINWTWRKEKEYMLKDNLKILRKNKGLSQEELSVKLHVVR